VGLDSSSFGEGEGGLAFHQGNTQMGDPNRPVQVAAKSETKAAAPASVFHPPRALNPTKPKYPERARRRNIEGFVLIEADINEKGELRDARVRKGCDPILDKAALETVRQWQFEPASMSGRKVASTHLIRIKFALV
jgi:TonB family protein